MKIKLKKPASVFIVIFSITLLAVMGYIFESLDDEPFVTKTEPSPVAVNVRKPTEAPHRQLTNDKININTADEELLVNLDGIGEAFAKRIVDYRNEHGSFKRIEDIMLVRGIGGKKFEKIKDFICVE